MAQRLIADVRSIDTTRPIVMGSDKYRSVPEPGLAAGRRSSRMLDGLGLNYNTAGSVDALHARYPDKFLFESESSSETSTRGEYQDPDQLNTGENFTPEPAERLLLRQQPRVVDDERRVQPQEGSRPPVLRRRVPVVGDGLHRRADAVLRRVPGQDVVLRGGRHGRLREGPVLPVQEPVDDAGRWSTCCRWTGRATSPARPCRCGRTRTSTRSSCFLNGRSLGVRRFDRKRSPSGEEYLETTEATDDDKTVVGGPFPGSYTSPNGSAGHLYLSWDVPFEPGRLVAVARRGGSVVARDAVVSAGEPYALRLSTDRRAGHGSLAYVTADVVDRHGVLVPGADDLISLGRLRRRLDRRPRQRPRGGPRGLQGHRPHRVQRQGARDRARPAARGSPPRHRAALRLHHDRSCAAAAAIPVRATAGAGRAAVRDPGRRRELLGRQDTIPAAMLDGDMSHGLVEPLRRGRDRAAARDQPRPRDAMGVGRRPRPRNGGTG